MTATIIRIVFENDCLLRYLLSFLFDESALETWSRTAEPDALVQICTLKLVNKNWLIFLTREVCILEISIHALLSKTWPTITRSQYLCVGYFVRLRSIIVRANRDYRNSNQTVWWGVPSSLSSLFGFARAEQSSALININLHLKINLELNSDFEQLLDDSVSICSSLPRNIKAIDVLDFSGSSSRLDYPILSSFMGKLKLNHIRINNLRLDNCVGILSIDNMEELISPSRVVCKEGEQANGARMEVYMNGCWALAESSYAPTFWIDLESPMQMREIAQVVIISGVHRGEWVFCTVIRVHPLVARDTEAGERSITRRIHEQRYDIFVHPTEDFQRAVGFSGRIAADIRRVYLRRVTPIRYDTKIQIT